MKVGEALTEQAFWDKGWQVRHQARHVDLGQYNHYRIARFFDAYLPHGRLQALEVGAGHSIWLPYMIQKYGYSVIGLDYSRVGCEMLKANLEDCPQNAYLVIEADMFHCCFKQESFDVIFSNGLIEHFTDYPALVALFKSWLKPGGLLVTFVPNKKHIFRHVEKRLASDVYNAHVRLTPGDLLAAYQMHDLKDIKVGYLGSFFTWKYNSYAQGLKRPVLSGISKMLNLTAHTLLRTFGHEPESKAFSPIIYALGKI